MDIGIFYSPRTNWHLAVDYLLSRSVRRVTFVVAGMAMTPKHEHIASFSCQLDFGAYRQQHLRRDMTERQPGQYRYFQLVAQSCNDCRQAETAVVWQLFDAGKLPEYDGLLPGQYA